MKRYPKRPFLISGHRYSQLWFIIPLCIFSIFCKGCGIIGALLIFGLWFYYSVQVSEQEWKNSCDKGFASIYCPRGYLESQGFRENHGSNIEEIPKVVITQEMINQYRQEIENKKKKLEEMIIDYHIYTEMDRKYTWHNHRVEENNDAVEFMKNMGMQLVNNNFKYMPQKEIEKWRKSVYYEDGVLYKSLENDYVLIAAHYIFLLCDYLYTEINRTYQEIMVSIYGKQKYGYVMGSHEDVYEKLMKGESLYGDCSQNVYCVGKYEDKKDVLDGENEALSSIESEIGKSCDDIDEENDDKKFRNGNSHSIKNVKMEENKRFDSCKDELLHFYEVNKKIFVEKMCSKEYSFELVEYKLEQKNFWEPIVRILVIANFEGIQFRLYKKENGKAEAYIQYDEKTKKKIVYRNVGEKIGKFYLDRFSETVTKVEKREERKREKERIERRERDELIRKEETIKKAQERVKREIEEAKRNGTYHTSMTTYVDKNGFLIDKPSYKK